MSDVSHVRVKDGWKREAGVILQTAKGLKECDLKSDFH